MLIELKEIASRNERPFAGTPNDMLSAASTGATLNGWAGLKKEGGNLQHSRNSFTISH
jgi:hypothetical protein